MSPDATDPIHYKIFSQMSTHTLVMEAPHNAFVFRVDLVPSKASACCLGESRDPRRHKEAAILISWIKPSCGEINVKQDSPLRQCVAATSYSGHLQVILIVGSLAFFSLSMPGINCMCIEHSLTASVYTAHSLQHLWEPLGSSM